MFLAIIGGEYALQRGLNDGTSVDGRKVGATTNHLLSPKYGYDDAFDHFESPSESGEGLAGFVSDKHEPGSTPYKLAAVVWNQFERARSKVVKLGKSFRHADDVIKTFFKQTDGYDDWFGWLHFMEPHLPNDPHSAPVSRDYANRVSRKAISHRVNAEEAELVRDFYRRECEELDIERHQLWEDILTTLKLFSSLTTVNSSAKTRSEATPDSCIRSFTTSRLLRATSTGNSGTSPASSTSPACSSAKNTPSVARTGTSRSHSTAAAAPP